LFFHGHIVDDIIALSCESIVGINNLSSASVPQPYSVTRIALCNPIDSFKAVSYAKLE
jgi:hypothetical protein